MYQLEITIKNIQNVLKKLGTSRIFKYSFCYSCTETNTSTVAFSLSGGPLQSLPRITRPMPV